MARKVLNTEQQNSKIHDNKHSQLQPVDWNCLLVKMLSCSEDIIREKLVD